MSGRTPFHAHTCAPMPRPRPFWHPSLRTAATPKVPPTCCSHLRCACMPGSAGCTTIAHGASGACQALTRARRACIVAVAAAAAAADGHPAHEGAGLTPLQKAAAFRQAFWKFLRPHTIRGTILGSATVTARALIECPIVSRNMSLHPSLLPVSQDSLSFSASYIVGKPGSKRASLGPVLWQPLDWSLLPRALLGVLALLAGNGYIVGINQIYDVEIDTVNKPFLPIAAGTAP